MGGAPLERESVPTVCGWLDADGENNLLRYIFLRPEARTLILDWTSRAHRVVAEFRAAVTGYSDDPDIRRLVDE